MTMHKLPLVVRPDFESKVIDFFMKDFVCYAHSIDTSLPDTSVTD